MATYITTSHERCITLLCQSKNALFFKRSLFTNVVMLVQDCFEPSLYVFCHPCMELCCCCCGGGVGPICHAGKFLVAMLGSASSLCFRVAIEKPY